MGIEELIHPGVKVDVYPLLRGDEEENLSQRDRVYKSQLLDFAKNGNLIISMPMDGGKMVLLPLNIRFAFVFYARQGLYRAEGQAVNRYKTENCYMVEVELKSQLDKFQRREYYRYPCLIDMTYFEITEDELATGTGERIFVQLQQKNLMEEREHFGRIIDLSGGGIKIRTAEKIAPGTNLLMWIFLKSDAFEKQYYILGNTIECVLGDTKNELKYESRIRFILDDDKTREDIIRYIFEEERKARSRTGR
jgi:c-di-GMP-binding flagellar brake protein YcgR